MNDPAVNSRHARLMDADAYWRQFVTNFYFENPKDEITGHVLELVNVRKDEPPAIKVQTKEGRVYIVTGHQARLRWELVRQAPAVGDVVTITYHGEAKKAAPGMNKAKEFTVTVKRPGQQPAAAS